MTDALAVSVKTRLRNIAREQGRLSQDLWRSLFIDRLLARLAETCHRDTFVFKGGAMLARAYGSRRETRDIDFTVRESRAGVATVEEAFNEIIDTDLKDGFSFGPVEARPLVHPHMERDGVVVEVQAYLHDIRQRLHIDLAHGDTFEASERELPLVGGRKGPLFERAVCLWCYSLPYVFAEKLHAMVVHGEDNTRMKDFEDILTLKDHSECTDQSSLREAIDRVFRNRQTILKVPLVYDNMHELQARWVAYLRKRASPVNLPQLFSDVLSEINQWLFVALGVSESHHSSFLVGGGVDQVAEGEPLHE